MGVAGGVGARTGGFGGGGFSVDDAVAEGFIAVVVPPDGAGIGAGWLGAITATPTHRCA
jgi:hypothetical protein